MRLLRQPPAPGTVHDGIEYTSTIMLPSKSVASRKRSLRRGYSRFRVARRRVVNLIISLSVLIMAVLAGAVPAQAGWTDDLLEFTCPPPYLYAEATTDPLAWLLPSQDAANFNSAPRTAFEKYGMGGLRVSYFMGEKDAPADSPFKRPDGGCQQIEKRLDGIIANNFAFKMTGAVIGFTNYLYGAAFDISGALEGIMKTFGEEFAIFFRDSLYFDFLLPVLMIGACHLAWVGIVKRQSTTARQAFCWMAGAVVIGSLILFSPTRVSGFVLSLVNGTQSTVAASMSQFASKNIPEDSLCYLPPTYTTSVNNNAGSGGAFSGSTPVTVKIKSSEHSIRTMQCVYWETFAFRPWVQAQFGVGYDDPELKKHMGPVQIGNRQISANLAVLQLDAQNLDASITGSRDDARARKMDAWVSVKDSVATTGVWSDWRGDSSGDRYMIPLLSVVGGIVAGILIVGLSAMMLFFKILLLLNIAVMPIYLLIGAHPGHGRRVLMGYAEEIASQALKLIALSFGFGIVVAFFIAIQNATIVENNYGAGFIMMTLGAIAMAMWGLKFLKIVSAVNLGGGPSGIENQGAGGGAKKVGGGLAGATAGLIGGLGGATKAVAAGGGGAAAVRTIAKSGMQGAQRGATSGGAGRGAMAGLRAGSQSARTSVSEVKNKVAAAERSRSAEADPSAYVKQQQETDRLIREVREHEDDPQYATLFKKQYGTTVNDFQTQNPQTSSEARTERRVAEAQEYEAKKDDSDYMESLKAKHGGKLPSYLADDVSRERLLKQNRSTRPQGRESEPKPDLKKPDAQKPDAQKPDLKKPDLKKPSSESESSASTPPRRPSMPRPEQGPSASSRRAGV